MAILRIAVPYTGMILSTRESPAMRDALLAVGMSQMSAGSRTDVGAYHRHDGAETQEKLGDLHGQFTLMDHRPASEIVKDLMRKGYVPSWCAAWLSCRTRLSVLLRLCGGALGVLLLPLGCCCRCSHSQPTLPQPTPHTPHTPHNTAHQHATQHHTPTHHQHTTNTPPTHHTTTRCTACYRKGRTGEAFMKIAKAGEIHNFCHPNSLLTLQEYLNDYGEVDAFWLSVVTVG